MTASDELKIPYNAYFGTLSLTSPTGSKVETYAYIDPDLRWHPLAKPESSWVVSITFGQINRLDQMHFQEKKDYELYRIQPFEQLLTELLNAGWIIKVL